MTTLLNTASVPTKTVSFGWACLKYMQKLGWDLKHQEHPDRPGEYWIQFGIEDFAATGHPLPNNFGADEFNDRYVTLIWIPKSNSCVLIQNDAATTEPGKYYTYNPMNEDGAMRMNLETQYKAWKIGPHGKRAYEAMVQRGPVGYTRDKNEDGSRTGDLKYTSSDNGCNLHHAGDSFLIDMWGAGCQVLRFVADHVKRMGYAKTYLPKNGFYAYGILDGSKFYEYWKSLGIPSAI